MEEKITGRHLSLLAIVYVRVSTPGQVIKSIDSKARQYDMKQRALDLGWPRERIKILDDDLGKSGADTYDRTGFKWMCEQILKGRIGAVFCLEVTRLSRDCEDFYRLVKICGATETLIVDEKCIHDSNDDNNLLLLQILGALGQKDLSGRRTQLNEAKLRLAKEGLLRFKLPVGLAYDAQNKIIINPDIEVRRAVSLLFELFELYGTALAVAKHFYDRDLKYPARVIGGEHKGEIRWSPIKHSRVLQELHNPLYAGAYVYGRSQYKRVWRDDNGTLKRSSVQIKRKESLVVRRGNHEGYITWGQHQDIEQRLRDNTYRYDKGNSGAVRTGAALLQGLVWCGKCGARMRVFYGNVRSYGYSCERDSVRFGERRCQSIAGFYIDAAVKEKVLLAAAPAQLEMSIRALDRLDSVSAEASRQKKTALDRARRAAEVTQGHLLRVEPELALAAGKLRKSLNESLELVERLEREYEEASRSAPRALTVEARDSVLALASDLPAVFESATTTQVQRKQLLRCLVSEVRLSRGGGEVGVKITWRTGATTSVQVILRIKMTTRMDPTVIDLIRAKTVDHTDKEIAEHLNERGFMPARAPTFTASVVRLLRGWYGIPPNYIANQKGFASDRRPDGRYTSAAAAKLLNVCRASIQVWCRAGVLDGVKHSPNGAYWVKLTPELIAQMKRPGRRKLPHDEDPTKVCPQCHAITGQRQHGYNRTGSERFKCGQCLRLYTPEPILKGYPEALRRRAVSMHTEGMSYSQVGRTLKVNPQSVCNWVNSARGNNKRLRTRVAGRQ